MMVQNDVRQSEKKWCTLKWWHAKMMACRRWWDFSVGATVSLRRCRLLQLAVAFNYNKMMPLMRLLAGGAPSLVFTSVRDCLAWTDNSCKNTSDSSVFMDRLLSTRDSARFWEENIQQDFTGGLDCSVRVCCSFRSEQISITHRRHGTANASKLFYKFVWNFGSPRS